MVYIWRAHPIATQLRPISPAIETNFPLFHCQTSIRISSNYLTQTWCKKRVHKLNSTDLVVFRLDKCVDESFQAAPEGFLVNTGVPAHRLSVRMGSSLGLINNTISGISNTTTKDFKNRVCFHICCSAAESEKDGQGCALKCRIQSNHL